MAHIMVVGAGIVGVSTAIWLQRAGQHVTLVDKSGPASGTSFGNAGVLAAGAIIPVTTPGLWKKAPFMVLDKDSPLFVRWRYLPRLIPFLSAYLRKCNAHDVAHYAKGMLPLIYDTVQQHRSLAEGTPAQAFIQDADYCFGYDSEAAFVADKASWTLREQFGLEFVVETGSEYARTDPLYADKFHTVVRCKHHGMVSDPGAYVKALAEHFTDQGGDLVIAEVDDITQANDGRPEVRTSQGRLSADKLVLTAGAWSRPLLEGLGLKVPLESERGYHLELVEPERYPVNPMMVAAGKFAVTPMNGRIRCAGVVEFGGLRAKPQLPPRKMLKSRVEKLFADLAFERYEEWMGHRPALTDSLPMLGEVTPDKTIFTAFGHQHLGLTGGAKTGRIVAGLLTAEPVNLDMAPYLPDRF